MTAIHKPEAGWSDEALEDGSDPSTEFEARVLPATREPTRIVLSGHCPRCQGQMTSVHTVYGWLTQSEARERFPPHPAAATESDPYYYRLIALQCQCAYTHSGAPAGEHGCGTPIAFAARWPLNDRSKVTLIPVTATPFEHREERELQETFTDQLAQIRKAAESWRTALGGFLAVLAVVFFVKGATSFDDVASKWHVWLAVLLLASGGSALFAAYRATRAAYGTPADEYPAGRVGIWKKLFGTTPRHPHKFQSVGAWHDAIGGQSVSDLRQAKVAAVFAAIFFAAAAAVTWLAPGPAGTERLVIEARTGTICGKVAKLASDGLIVDGAREIAIRDVRSVKPVAKCPSQ